jgi:eukaryotic-like serine/threonine-protein kinase
MPLAGGTKLGPYEIVAPLGVGGMGEVYSATDPRLKRQVAIKVLPTALSAAPDRLARFEREAEVLASLNHPHVAAIYGVEESSGVKALVMELVDGPTLADRIAQGRIPFEEALPIARQIADALEAAHEQGIIHRDLKPANIKVRDDGTVKVLDFGLAKAVERSEAAPANTGVMTIDSVHSPTLASPVVSQAGVILGTAAYMSPEQARGKSVDKRTDVWAFGAVLYEMLAGGRAFAGDDVTEVITSVMKSTPDWSAIPPDVPPSVVALIQRCLDKDRKTRVGDIAVARFLLSGDAIAAAGAAASHTLGQRSRTAVLAWAGAALLAGTIAGWMLPRSAPLSAPQSMTHAQIGLAPAEQLTPAPSEVFRPSRTAFSLSPDGRTIAFAGAKGNGAQLYVRALDRPEAAALAGTEGAAAPFFSPDGQWIGFVADNKIKKVPASGGPASTVCDIGGLSQFWGASWGDQDTIMFAVRDGIFTVAAAGGTPAAVTKPDPAKGQRHLLPHALPGGRAIVFTDPPNIVYQPLDGAEPRVLFEGADARYIATGHLLFIRSATLMAVPFDVRSGQTTGSPVAMIEHVMHAINAGNSGNQSHAAQYAVSSGGTLAYVLGGMFPSRQALLTWVDRRGVAQPFAGAEPRPYLFPRLSPDGERLVVSIRTDESRNSDVWVYDVARGTPTRITFDGAGAAVWTGDSRRIVYAARNLFAINADGSGKPEQLTSGDVAQNPMSLARRAGAIAYSQRPSPTAYGLWMLPLQGSRSPEPLLESRFPMTHADLSPDGRWVVYASPESGTEEIYVQAYPGGGSKTRISSSTGYEPIWSPTGREIFFRSYSEKGEQLFFSATIPSLAPFRVDPPKELFRASLGQYDATTPNRSWDVSPDGQRFLLLKNMPTSDKAVTAVNVVLNWTDELKRRAPVP